MIKKKDKGRIVADKLYVVTAEKLEFTGRLSFVFMLHSGMPTEWRSLRLPWAILVTEEEDDHAFVNVFRDGKMVFGWGGYITECDRIIELIQEMPNAIILMSSDMFNIIKTNCAVVGVELFRHHYQGTLKTS